MTSHNAPAMHMTQCENGYVGSVSGRLPTEYSIIMSLDVPFMSAILNFRAQQPSLHLVHNKNTSPPTILEIYVSLPALTETCFEVNTLGEFPLNVQYALKVDALREGDALAAPATSYSRDLIEYMTADAWVRALAWKAKGPGSNPGPG